MILLRSLQFHRAMHIVTDLSCNMSRAIVATSFLRSLTGTRLPFKVVGCDLKDTDRCFPRVNFVFRYYHCSLRCSNFSQNAVNSSLSKKLPEVETVKPRHVTDTASVATDSLLVKDQLSHTKDILKSDVDSEKIIHIDESKRELVVYVDNTLVKTKAIDLYKVIRKMGSEEVLSLLKHSHDVLDKTHFALAMKRLFTLSTRDPQNCDADVISQDERFHILCAYLAKKARYLQPAILNDIVTFLCHFGITSSDSVMRVCLQLMMKQINNLALDQLTMLAHGLGGMEATKQTRVLHEAIGILCSTRDDQLSMLSVVHKIYLLEEFGCKLPYTGELLESLWDIKREVRSWQQAIGFFVALAKASAPTAGNESTRTLPRHEPLEEWCMDILRQQYVWLSIDDIEALLSAFVQLDIYDGGLLRILGSHALHQSEKLMDRLSVWSLLAGADYMHIGLMEAMLTDLKDCDIQQMAVDTQLLLLPLLAESANYYCGHATDSEELCVQSSSDTVSACVEELQKTLQTSENVPADLQLDMCLYLTLLCKSPPDLLSSHILDTCSAEMSTGSSSRGHPREYFTQLDKLMLLASLQNSSDTVHARVSQLAAEQSRPRSVLRPALLMFCDDVAHGISTPLAFYADHILPSKTTDTKSVAVLCWYDSHHFWINTGRLKCIPHLYATSLQRLHNYNVLVVNASAWLSLSERERFMYIATTLTKELHGVTVI